eukprot:281578-Karenia_brevis.AAC.1
MIATALLQAHMVFVFRMKRNLEHPEASSVDREANHIEDAVVNAAPAPSPAPSSVELFADVNWTFDVGRANPIK